MKNKRIFFTILLVFFLILTLAACNSDKKKTYTITWSVNGEETKEVYFENTVPSFKGSTNKESDEQYTYKFEGWEPKISPVTRDATYIAQYTSELRNYTITWNVNGMETTEEYNYGETPVFKGDTSKESTKDKTFTFVGWDKEISSVNGDSTYTAQYSETGIEYTITYMLNGGINDSNNPTNYITGSKLELKDVSKEGYTFLGWTGSNGGLPQTNFESTSMVGNLTFSANWEANHYVITYNVNGGDSLKPNMQEVIYDENTELSTPTREGYTFNGWYYEDKKIDNGRWNRAENVTLVASWQANQYTVTYDVNGGDPLEKNTQTVTYDFVNEFVIPTKAGYTFVGWFNGDKKIENEKWAYAKDVVLIANWEVTTYLINYILGVNADNESNPTTYTINDPVKIKEISKDGYIFIGWTFFDDDTPQKRIDTSSMMGDLTLTANWGIVQYTITYDTNSGENDPNNPTTYTVEDDIELMGAYRTGYIFTGWTSTSEDTPNKEFELDGSYGDLVLTANWEPMKFKINYTYCDGTDKTSIQEVNYGEPFTLVKPVYRGYYFNGWYQTYYPLKEGVWTYLEDISLKGVWSIIYYNITYDLQGGVNNASNPKNYTVNQGVVLQDAAYDTYTYENSKYLKNNKKFVGWYLDDKYQEELHELGVGEYVQDMKFYAKFEGSSTETTEIDCLTNGFLRADGDGNYNTYGDYIKFGFYPQSEVRDEALLYQLVSASIKLGFTSYRYYLNSKQADFMYYKDIDLDKDGYFDYRCVSFTNYRPELTNTGYPEGYMNQQQYGYNPNVLYFFKYEPILWRVLEGNGLTYKLHSNYVLDSQPYNYTDSSYSDGTASSNYEKSSIRVWLNSTFYNTSFNTIQKKYIQSYAVESQLYPNVMDNVGLLNRTDARFTYSNKFPDCAYRTATDYAKCQGLMYDYFSERVEWWTCTPDDTNDKWVDTVSPGVYGYNVMNTNTGVAPAIKLMIHSN